MSVKRLRHWLWDDCPGWFLDSPLQPAALRLVCRIYGHLPERDQCNRPEHDYCIWCGKSMPGMYVGRVQ